MWDGMEHAAAIAQVAGVDLFGLISMTVRAARMARQNSRRCRELAERVERIGDLLGSLEQMPGAAVMQRPETSAPLMELRETLQQACALVESCRRGSYVRRLCVGGAKAGRFRDVQSRIGFYLQLFPIISHIENTRLLVRVIDGAAAVPPHDCEPEGDEEEVLRSLTNQPNPLARFQKFSFSQLLNATNNFSVEEEMERSPLAASYKGQLYGGDVSVTIKRLSASSSGQKLPQSMNAHELFKNEVEILPELRHKNIVKLVGFCAERSERILVYEHMRNGSLEDIIFGRNEAGLKLDWPSRFRIIEGVAQGAGYLHHHSGLRMIHCDLKPSNVLLDADMNPKICNFDLAKMLSPGMDEETTGSVIGSIGFIAPEYMQKGAFSVKTDVYSFGVMVLEIISGKRWTQASQQSYYQDLLKWAWALYYGGRAARRLQGFVHPSLHGVSFCSRVLPRCLSFPARRSVLSQQREMKRCVQTSLICIQEKPERRPSMIEVTRMLSPRKARVPPLPRRVRFTKQSALYAGEEPVA